MDQWNVINITDNLEDLTNDYSDWAQLPFDFRKRSDEECIRRYGCTVTTLFDKLRAAIISHQPIDDDKDTIFNISVNEATKIIIPDLSDNDSVEKSDFLTKVEIAKDLDKYPDICVLIPGEYNTIEDLDRHYMKYINLSDNLKRFSDSYSYDVWGYNVYNMYSLIRSKLEGETLKSPNTNEVIYRAERSNSNIYESFKFRIDACNENITGTDRSTYNEALKKINEDSNEIFDSIMNPFVPYFTPDEMEDLSVYDNILEDGGLSSPQVYEKLIRGLMEDYAREEVQENPITKVRLEKTIISLGWNPEVPITEKSIEFARNKQLEYYKNHLPQIIDITHLGESSQLLQESTQRNRKMYDDYNLHPIYIVISFNGTLMNKIVRFVKGSTYTHAGLTLDSDLQNIYTFKISKHYNGFQIESIDNYLKSSNDALISVLCIFVDKATEDKIERVLRDFISKQINTKYGISNLINILFNRAKADNPEALKLVCSQFVDLVLKLANIDLTDKPNNLVIPQDFQKISDNPKVFKIYEGYTRDYNEKVAEGHIYHLFHKFSDKDIRYTDYIEFTIENGFNMDLLDYVTENAKANEIINEYRALLTPVAVITEKK